MGNNSIGRPSKSEIRERREKIRELYLQGKAPTKIANIIGCHYNTVLSDLKQIQARYSSLIINNSQLAKKQFQKVEQLLDEVQIIKKNYWNLYDEIVERVKENENKYKVWEEEVKGVKDKLAKAEKDLEETNDKETRIKVRELRKKLDYISREPKYPTYITSRIDSLKAILDRVDKEAKLLSLFNPQSLIDQNYVSIEVLKSIMEIFKGIIMELIPEEKRVYAFKRLKTIDIHSLSGEDVVDAEYTETKPKKIKPKTEDIDEEIDI